MSIYDRRIELEYNYEKMKYSLLILVVYLSVCHGFFGSVGQTLNNLGDTANQVKNDVEDSANKVVDEVNKLAETTGTIIGQILDVANGVQFAAKFLWETVFSLKFDSSIQSGQTDVLSDKYAQLTSLWKSNIANLYGQFFLMEQEALKAVQNGETNFEERVRSFNEQFSAIKLQIEQWAQETKTQLEAHASTIEGEWQIILNEYKQNIDSTIASLEELFEKIKENFVKNYLDFVSTMTK